MDLTLTQAILFYYAQIKFDSKKMQEFQAKFLPLLLDGMSSTNRSNYRLFCSRFREIITTQRFGQHLNILDVNFEQNTFFDPVNADSYDSYKMPTAYYLNPHEFIETHRNKKPEKEFINIVYTIAQDQTRRVFESSLAWSVLANIPETFLVRVLEWNTKLFNFLKLCVNQLSCDEIFAAQKYMDVYEKLFAINIRDSSLKFPEPKEIFKGRMLWDTHSVAHEVYDILKISCQPSLQMHDHRMTIGRRETIKAVSLSWLLIRIVLDVFNQTLHLKDIFDNFIDIPNFRGRMVIPENLRGDRPIDAPDQGQVMPLPWPVHELGVVRGRTPMPHHPVSDILDDIKGVPTYYITADTYTFPKALENCFVEATSCWATFCREQKVHPAIGGGSGSFFYVFRVLLSTQDKIFYPTLFPGMSASTYSTLDMQSNFTASEFFLFVKILACLWVGVTGGHCFHEIIFTLNMNSIVKKNQEIFRFDSSCNLMTLLGMDFVNETLRSVLNQASDYNTNRIFHKNLFV